MHKDPRNQEIKQKLQQVHVPGYEENEENLLMYRGKLYVPNIPKMKEMILDEYHKNPFAGHLGY